MIQVYTGDGKGKTTAALGLAIRAAGADKQVRIVYFDKGGDNYSERKALRKISDNLPNLQFYATGLDRIDADNNFRFQNTEEDKQEACRALEIVSHLIDEGIDIIILDEVNTSIHLGLISKEQVLELIKKAGETELILTGRYAPKEIIEAADLVSQINPLKHYFDGNVNKPARAGIDY